MNVYVVMYQLHRPDPYIVEGVFKSVNDAKFSAEALVERYESDYIDFCVDIVPEEAR